METPFICNRKIIQIKNKKKKHSPKQNDKRKQKKSNTTKTSDLQKDTSECEGKK